MEDVVKHAEAFESALRDHAHLQDTSEVMANKVSQYKRQSRNFTGKSPPCTGCGNISHASKDRATRYPAWGKTCLECGALNHFGKVYHKKNIDTAEALVAPVSFMTKKRDYLHTEQKSLKSMLNLLPTNRTQSTHPR